MLKPFPAFNNNAFNNNNRSKIIYHIFLLQEPFLQEPFESTNLFVVC